MRPAGAGGRRQVARVPGARVRTPMCDRVWRHVAIMISMHMKYVAHSAGEILTPASSRFAPAVYVLST
eukprot:scaffold19347_cov157-Isochrysis_galbana.AAC.2